MKVDEIAQLKKITRKLTLRFAIIQGTYWMAFAALISFASVYLLSKGFTNVEIGFVMAFSNVAAVFVQPVLAAIADNNKSLQLKNLIAITLCAAIITAFILIWIPQIFWIIILVFMSVVILQLSLQPLINSLSFEYAKQGILLNFGVARACGSISFAILTSFLGGLVEEYSTVVLPLSYVLCSLVCVAVTLSFRISKKQKAEQQSEGLDKQELIHQSLEIQFDEDSVSSNEIERKKDAFAFVRIYPRFFVLLLGVVLVLFSHCCLNTFTIQIIENVGGNSNDMGLTFSLAALAEIPTMVFFAFLVKKVKCSTLFRISGIFFCIKNLVAVMAVNVFWIHISQGFQLLAYALFLPASVYYANLIMKEHDKVKGQAFLGVAACIAGSTGSLIGGILIDSFSVSMMMWFSMFVALIGAIIIFFAVENTKLQRV